MRALALFAFSLVALTACETMGPGWDPVVPPPPIAAPPPVVTAEAPPADPPPVTDGDVTVASASGIRVLVKRIPGAEMAALQLYIRGGARNWTAADAGVERLALALATSGGTESLDKDAFSRRLAALGSDIGAEARLDYSVVRAKALGARWDETFALLADAFLHPALPAGELELVRQRQLSALRHEHDNPDALLALRVHEVVYRGHPFANRAVGTPETVKAVDLAAVRAHLGRLREASRLLFVTAGDVDPAHVVEKVRATFGGLARGAYQDTAFPPLAFARPTLTVTQKELPTNYVEGVFPVPTWRDEGRPAAMVAMSLLRYRLFEEVRTKRNLSYAPSAGLGGSSVPTGYLYVTAVDPNTTLRVMLDEARRLQRDPVSEKDLAGTKASFLTTYLMQSESTDGQASMLADADLLGGDWKTSRTLPERIRAVTPAAVQAFAQKYFTNLQMVVLGDPAKVDKALFESL